MTRTLQARFAGLFVSSLLLACSPPDARPSIVLIVVDTLRTSAVSSYGEVDGTTPALDALAAVGVRYTRAYSTSSWTLPAHASLFTGLGVDEHRVGTRGRLVLPEEVVTIAEQLRDAGYETAAFTENMLVSEVFDQLQGFETQRSERIQRKGEGRAVHTVIGMNLERELEAWLETRDQGRPFFVFVNIFDAHSPYTVRDRNPWVPEGTTRAEMERHAEKPEQNLCAALPRPRELEALRGLYLGDVAAADAKVGFVLERLAAAAGERALVRIVTSDHGELFGERRLLGHEFNLREGSIHVPLVVAGAPGAAPGVVDAPVSLLDLAPSIRAWSGIDPAAPVLPLRSSEAPRSGPGRDLLASYSDDFVIAPEQWRGVIEFRSKLVPRARCGPNDKVHGAMASLLRWPYKLYWYERYEPELYDLSWDPEERSNQYALRPDLAGELSAEIERYVERAGLRAEDSAADESPTPEAIEALRALGYIDD